MEITRIGLGAYNCYLLNSGGKFLLVDTGTKSIREKLLKALEEADCSPKDIRLIVLTHGDHDHSGNCKYFKQQYGIETAMHEGDTKMVELGDMTEGRKAMPDRKTPIFRLMQHLSRPAPFDRFSPDILLEDGGSLSEYGFDVKVAHIPGHTKGSIALIAPNGGAVCGDIFCNFTRPQIHILIDDMKETKKSVKKLISLGVKDVYPGHGKPFKFKKLKL